MCHCSTTWSLVALFFVKHFSDSLFLFLCCFGEKISWLQLCNFVGRKVYFCQTTDIVWAHSINNHISNQPVSWSRKCAYNVKLYLFQQSLGRRIWSHKSWFPLKLPCIVCTHRLTDKMFALNSISFCTTLYDFYIWQIEMEGKGFHMKTMLEVSIWYYCDFFTKNKTQVLRPFTLVAGTWSETF